MTLMPIFNLTKLELEEWKTREREKDKERKGEQDVSRTVRLNERLV